MSSFMTINFVAVGLTRAVPLAPQSQVDVVMLCSFIASFASLVCYVHRHVRTFTIGLALALATMAICAMIQGAWPIGIAELVWAGVAFSRVRRRANAIVPRQLHIRPTSSSAVPWETESRLSRMFGRN